MSDCGLVPVLPGRLRHRAVIGKAHGVREPKAAADSPKICMVRSTSHSTCPYRFICRPTGLKGKGCAQLAGANTFN